MPRKTDDITLTAYALGELDGVEHAAERAELDAMVTSDELTRRQVDEIRATAQQVRAELAAEAIEGLSEIQHATIERRLEWADRGDQVPIPLRPPRRNWAFWGSLAASVVIVCTVMATVLPKLYHLAPVGSGDGRSALPAPATGAAPFIVENPQSPSVSGPDRSQPLVSNELRVPFDGPGSFDAASAEWGENPFVWVADVPVCGVPTMSTYPEAAGKLTSIARYLDNHQLPPADAVRTDEIINALPYHYAAPTSNEAINASLEVARCPWDASHRLLRIGLRTADATPASRPSTSPSVSDEGIPDLKARIEFNPAIVGAYRLIGYEMSTGNFGEGSSDSRDTRHIGAGQSTTVLYEIIPVGMSGAPAPPPVPPLKYQKLTPIAETSRELATMSIHYRDAKSKSGIVRHREFPVTDDGQPIAAASDDFRTAAAAAAFGLALRDSANKGAATFDLVVDTLGPIGGEVREKAKLIELATKAKQLVSH